MSHSNTLPAVTAGLLPVAAPVSRPAPFVPFKRISFRTAIWSFLLGVALVGPVMIVVGLLQLPAITPDLTRPQRFLDLMLHPGVWLLKAVVIAPLWEEIFYRGLILQLARRYLTDGKALVLSTVIFAVPHAGMGLGTAALALMIGAALAWLVIRSGSLRASLLCHATVNFSWFFVLGPAFGITEKVINYSAGAPRINPLTDLFPAWWIALSLAMLAGAFVMLTRKTSPGLKP